MKTNLKLIVSATILSTVVGICVTGNASDTSKGALRKYFITMTHDAMDANRTLNVISTENLSISSNSFTDGLQVSTNTLDDLDNGDWNVSITAAGLKLESGTSTHKPLMTIQAITQATNCTGSEPVDITSSTASTNIFSGTNVITNTTQKADLWLNVTSTGVDAASYSNNVTYTLTP